MNHNPALQTHTGDVASHFVPALRNSTQRLRNYRVCVCERVFSLLISPELSHSEGVALLQGQTEHLLTSISLFLSLCMCVCV